MNDWCKCGHSKSDHQYNRVNGECGHHSCSCVEFSVLEASTAPPLDRDRFLERIAVALEKQTAPKDESGSKLLTWVRHHVSLFCSHCGMPCIFLGQEVNWCDAECVSGKRVVVTDTDRINWLSSSRCEDVHGHMENEETTVRQAIDRLMVLQREP